MGKIKLLELANILDLFLIIIFLYRNNDDFNIINLSILIFGLATAILAIALGRYFLVIVPAILCGIVFRIFFIQ